MEIIGTPVGESLPGTPDDDTITGLSGNDTLSGGDGFDTYVFGPGFGNDTVFEQTGEGDGGRIRFEGGITADQLRFVRPTTTDLVIEVGADSIRIENFYASGGTVSGRIDAIEFANGDPSIDLLSGELTFVGTELDESLSGAAQNETFVGLGGNDVLSGGTGFDTYVFGPGFGTDTIFEQLSEGDGGRIRFEGGITADQLRFVRPTTTDLVIEVGADSIRIENFYASGGTVSGRIDAIEFANGDPSIDLLSGELTFVGTELDESLSGAAQNETFVGLGGNDVLSGGTGFDTYVFGPGFGTDTIFEQLSEGDGGRIRFEGGITADQLRFVRPTTTDLVIEVGADSIRIENFYASGGTVSGRIDAIEFANGDPSIDLLSGELTFVGTELDESLSGAAQNETFVGLGGNDVLSGGTGFDTYVFGPGFGTDTIFEQLSEGDGGRIRFEGGITADQLRFVRPTTTDLVIEVGDDSIRIENFYASGGTVSGRIDAIEFANGDPSIDLLSGELTFVGTELDESLSGAAQNETFVGLGGNDVLSGGTGFDTYVFGPGFGTDTIFEQLSEGDGGRIRFEGGITADQLRFVRPTTTDLVIEVGADSIRIENFYASGGTVSGRIDAIEFANGDPSIDLLSGELTFVGTELDESLSGAAQNETFVGLGGNDVLSGGTGFDTYVFGPGFGTDTIFEQLSEGDGGRIRFEGGITADQLRFVRPTTTDLVIEVGDDSIRIENFYATGGTVSGRIDEIEFANGQLISLDNVELSETGQLLNLPPTATDDVAVTGVGEAVQFELLVNDTDPNGDNLQITAVGDSVFVPDEEIVLSSGGRITVGSNGQVTYVPSDSLTLSLLPGETFVDTFNYQIGDGRGGFDFATASVTVEAPDIVELALDVAPGISPGEIGTTELSVTVNAIPEGSDPSINQPYLVAVTADSGLFSDNLSGAFSDTTFVLVRDLAEGETGTIDLSIKGSAGPRSTLSATAQLANTAAAIDIAARTSALQADYVDAAVVSRIEANLVAEFGESVGSLAFSLEHYADRFETFGLNATSATAALAFAVEAAGDYGSINERGSEGSLGQGWATIADVRLEIDGTSFRLGGLTELSALQALSADISALYTVSSSADRSVALSGDVIALSAPTRPSFQQGVDGTFQTTTAFDGTLVQTSDGYQLRTSDGTTLEFDSSGIFLRMELPDARQVIATHDASSQIVGLSGPNGTSLTFNREADGKIGSVEDADGAISTFTYDGDGRLASVSSDEGVSTFSYDTNGDLVEAIAPGNIVAQFEYDTSGKLDFATYGSGLQTEDFAYDNAGGLTITDGAGRTTEINLLPGGTAGRITDGSGGASEIIYDENGNISGVRAPDGTETSFQFDEQNRLTTIIDANGAQLGFTYGETGEDPASFTDAGGNTRSFTYDDGGRITEATWPDGTTLQFSYDDQGNLAGYSNRRGDDVTYTYDERGRLLSESDSSAGPTSYVYDDQGRLISATNDQGTTTLAYDTADRVTQIDYPTGKSLSYTYNEAGFRESMSDGGDYNVFYQYDALGRLTGMRDEDSQIVTYVYNAAGNLIREENGNGTVSVFEYDDAGRLTLIENRAPDGSMNSMQAYSYDAAGQRVAVDTLDGDWTYGYDAIGQLTSAEFVSENAAIDDKSITYEYDFAGNRTRVVEDGVETLYTTNALNQYTQVGDATFTYDDDGNMVSRTDGEGTTTYTYDLDNRMASVTEADGTVLTFEYDVFGNRVAKTVGGIETEYLVDPFGLGDVVSEFSGGSLSATYAHGLGLAAGETSSGEIYYDSDVLGSTDVVTNEAGQVVNAYLYDPFGGEVFVSESVKNSFTFNGILGVTQDGQEFYNMGERSYSDVLGRFYSEDPQWIGGDEENLYRFAFNTPTTLVDPSGEIAPLLVFGFVAADAALKGLALYTIGKTGYTYYEAIAEGDASKAFGGAGSLAIGLGAGKLAGKLVPIQPSAAPANLSPFAQPSLTPLSVASRSLDSIKIELSGLALEGGANLLMGDALAIGQALLDGVTDFGDLLASLLGGGSFSPEAAPRPRMGGDPHIQTFDGLGYSFQAVGEFTMFAGANGEFEYQVRTSPLPNNDLVSVNSAVATEINGVTVGVYADRDIPLVINGRAIDLAQGETLALGDGSVYLIGATYVITNEFGDGVVVGVRSSAIDPFALTDFLTLQNFLAPERGAGIVGLFGNADGLRENDLALRDGTVLNIDPVAASELYGIYADSWRITNETSFFDYLEGESTETFTDTSFPRAVVTLDDLDPDARAAAELLALQVGLVPGTFEFDTTVLDLVLSGDPAFAFATQDIGSFDPDFDPATDFGFVTPIELNLAPTAEADTAEVDQGGTVLIDVLLNDTDPEDDPLEILGAGDVNGGQVDIVDGQLQFTAAPGFFGQTVISYQLGDGAGNAVLGSVTVQVNQSDNVAPTVTPIDAGRVVETAGVVLIDLLVDAGAADSDGGTLGVLNVSVEDQNGENVSFDLDGAVLSIDPVAFADVLGAGESVSLTVTYTVTDGQGGATPNTASLAIDGLDGPFTWFVDSDSDGFGVDDPSTNQTAYVAPEGTSDVAGDADDEDDTVYPGAPEINDLKDNDQDGLIDEDNANPVADVEAFNVAANTPLTLAVAALLDGDTDADGDVLTVASVSNAINGTVSLNDNADTDPPNDEVIFTPTAGFSGEASFDYAVADGFGGEDTVTVGVTVSAVANIAPTATPIDAGRVFESDGVVVIDLLVDAAAADSDGGTLGVLNVSVEDENGESVAFDLDGAVLSIDPGAFADRLGAGGSVSLTVTYDVSDGQGGATRNTATLVVDGLDGPFIWFVDGDGDGFGVDDAASNQTAYVAPEGTSGVAGDADDKDDKVYPGAPEINDFKDNDQDGLIDEDNTDPVADTEAFNVATNTPLTLPVAALLDGDTDADSDVLTVASVSNAFNGTVSLDDKADTDPANDEVIFTPTAGFSGDASFDYTVADGFGGEDTVTVGVTVSAVPNSGGAIVGGNTDDVLVGSPSNDRISGRRGDDTIEGGGGADNLRGGRGDDFIVGGEGEDILRGGKGADLLDGGNDNDVLRGGGGADNFRIGESSGFDVIADFERGADTLDLRDALSLTDHADVFEFLDTNEDGMITELDDFAQLEKRRLTIEIDGDGIPGNSNDFVQLKGINELSFADFGDFDML